MSPVTLLLNAAAGGDRLAAADLLPLVYEELRKLAANRLADESPNQTLQPTALVHEAYLRLVGPSDEARWENRGHFFAAAAEAMRRLLVENARHKSRLKRGGEWQRVDLEAAESMAMAPAEDLLSINDALTRLEGRDPVKAELVKLRFFAGLSMPEIARSLGLSLATTERHWHFARAWLYSELGDEDTEQNSGNTPES
ncbi:sigma-70 family RNA polymerase sigma factor [Zavarzinella formosa]|uniref:sigma-70 family RNA polymerase sigma factor n=1 Tax=Zavarzinella formosa TaxID=360055 RepID=UPI0003005835|nr:sigma-70 family RNA polymerase sigma factor [Zavarzinella formosa]